MRRTTQWAVFTSMNQQQPVWRSQFEPADHTAESAAAADALATPTQSETRSAPDTRRDRVDFM